MTPEYGARFGTQAPIRQPAQPIHHARDRPLFRQQPRERQGVQRDHGNAGEAAIGGAVAPFLVLWLYRIFDSWRPAFVITAAVCFLFTVTGSTLVLGHPVSRT